MRWQVFIFAIGSGIFVGALGLFLFQRSDSLSAGPIAEEKVLAAQAPIPLPDTVEKLETLNILLLGSGGAGHEGGDLTDAIILAHIDFTHAKIALISIPRDLWIEEQKINALYAHSYDKLRDGVATVTGESVDYYIGVDFVGFQRAMGYVLKGVEVNVAQDFDDPWYPIEGNQLEPCGHTPEEIAELTKKYSEFELQKQFACRYEHLHFNKGTVFINGGEALKYVRSRHSTSDFDRSRRQHEVLIAVKNKLFSLQALENIPTFVTEFTKYVHTNIDVKIAQFLAPALKNSKDYKVTSIDLSPPNVLKEGKSKSGAYIVLPKKDWEEVRSYVGEQFVN